MDTNEKLQEHIVAFIDVLGSKEATKKDEEKSLKVMHDSYTKAIKLFDYLFEDKQIKPEASLIRAILRYKTYIFKLLFCDLIAIQNRL